MKYMRRTVWILALSGLFLAVPVLAQPGSSEKQQESAAEPVLRPGMVLDQTTASLAADYLPPEILAHYQRGEYRNEIVDWPLGKNKVAPIFAQQTKRNAGTLAVNEVGTIIEKATGKQPPYIYGTPFPNIDPSDRMAAVKILWNYLYTADYWNGNTDDEVSVLFLRPDGLERTVRQRVQFKRYEGVPPEFRPPENRHNLLAQFVSQTTQPVDLYGTVALSWRFRDADKRDQVWAYVPALRRVRAVSPANRSDGFLGSEMSQDDGKFFDGKPEDFTWTLVGEKEILRFVDPYRLNGDVEVVKMPGGGWRSVLKPVPVYGYQNPSWPGVAWAMTAVKLALRKAWVIEAVPKDRYYLYGKIQLIFDQENCDGTYNRKFGWNGELINTLQTIGGPSIIVDGKYSFSAGPGNGVTCRAAENLKWNRATCITSVAGGLTRHVPLAPSLFNYQTLHRLGK